MTHEKELALQSSLRDLSGDGSFEVVFYITNLAWECLDPSPGRESFVPDKKIADHVISSHGEFPKSVWGSFGIPGGLHPPLLVLPPHHGPAQENRHQKGALTFPGKSTLT